MRHGIPHSRAERRELEQTLAALPPLSGCADKEIRHLAEAGRAVRLPAHWSLIAERTPGDTCYLLLEGEATVTSSGQQIATLTPGTLFGEVGLLDHRLRSATVTSTTPVRVLSLPYSSLEPLLTREPHLAEVLLADYHRRTTA